MGDYTKAPATKLLATHCAACRHPLVDAVSVNTGMGPDCRAKYFAEVPGELAENRRRANKLVYAVALFNSSHSEAPGSEVLAAIAEIGSLGFQKLAAVLIKRIAPVSISIEDGKLIVKAPYIEAAVPLLARVEGRFWDKARKANVYPLASKKALWAALVKAYPGMLAHGPNGFFRVETGAKAASPVAKDDAGAAGAVPPKGSSKTSETAAEIAARHGLPLPTVVDMRDYSDAHGTWCGECGEGTDGPHMDHCSRASAARAKLARLQAAHEEANRKRIEREKAATIHPDELEMMRMESEADLAGTIREEELKHAARAVMEDLASPVDKAEEAKQLGLRGIEIARHKFSDQILSH